VAKKRDSGFPTTDAIVAFIRTNPGKVGTREIAREFGLKNAERAELKRILRELADKGTISKRGKEISEPDILPATLLADITGRDGDGELIAIPASHRKSAFIFRAGHSQAPQQGSETAPCCGWKSSKNTTLQAPSIAVASSGSSTTPKHACSESSELLPAAVDD
jgi:hypothetical protein